MSAAVTEKNPTAEVASRIEKHLPPTGPTASLRAEALESFKSLGLPVGKAEEYKFTPITRTLEKVFSFASDNAAAQAVDPLSYKIDGLEADVLVFVNGVYSASASSVNSKVTVLPLSEAIQSHTDLVLKHLGKYADVKSDALTAWNTAAFADGIFIHVPDKTVVERPIALYHVNDTRNGQVITANRNLIVVGKSSEVTLIEKFDTLGAGPGFSNTVTEAFVSENAGLEFYSIQNDTARHQYGLIQVYQQNFSRVNTYTFTLNGKLVRNNLQLSLDGEGIESHMYGLYLITGDTLADNHTVVDHKKANSFSNEIYKGIMDGSSKGVFNGKIYVRPNAQKTNAFQANRNILMTDKATVNTKPQLEIWADDVKCSHGCTTGQLDEEALFYLRARGIDKPSAQAMILYAFAGEVLNNIKHPLLKTYLEKIVSERLHQNY
jgi:Fe-S cluster assembly protein SufD